MQFDVYGVGNAIMDLQVRCSDDFLKDNNIEKGVMTLTEPERQQEILHALSQHAVHYCSGGSAANTIVGLADLGGCAAYAGKTGKDDFGRRYLAEMRDLQIALEVPSAEDGPTGTCVVLITPDAQRTMLTHLGVSATLDASDIHEQDLSRSRYVYIEGYLFAGSSTRRAALKAIDLAQKHHVRIALTVSDPFIVDLCRDDFISLIEGPVDLLFCNELEAKALTRRDNPIDCAHELHRHCANVALTLGRRGSIIMHENELIPIEGVTVEAVDTTGAGDMYAAGVLYGITHGLSWQQAGHLGSHAAAQIVAQLGARLPRRYTHAEIEALLD
ncbi:MAG: adenosine kinase [Zetaproteobacteria bacterium]|nr:MAG: adenosine kinase [Zetaproteobacteria bacterium]